MLFVGEKRSELAKKMNVTWKDGKLAAKQLFDALTHCNVDPSDQEFCNWFEGGKKKVRSYKGTVVAMGHKVSSALKKEKINHIFIYHPATRGKIRKKKLYYEHVKTALFGMGNEITPFKGRSIDFSKPVWVYRNLNCKGVNYSIRQNGFVVAHATTLMLNNVEFKVSQAGRNRVLKTGERNVHAFAVGKISKQGGMGRTAKQCEERNERFPAHVKYNPRKHMGFTCDNLTVKPFIVKRAMCAIFTKQGVSAAYTD